MGITKFYKYFFLGVEKPIIMETESKSEADEMLNFLVSKPNSKVDMKNYIDFRIEMPLIGISKRKRKGQDFVWVGKNTTTDGWMLKTEFEKITKKQTQ